MKTIGYISCPHCGFEDYLIDLFRVSEPEGVRNCFKCGKDFDYEKIFVIAYITKK